MKSLLVYKALILLTGFTLAYSIPIKINASNSVGDLVSNDRKYQMIEALLKELEVVGQDSKTDTQNLNALVTKSEVTKATKKLTEGVTKEQAGEQTTTTTVKTTTEAKVQDPKVQVNPQEVVEPTTAKISTEANDRKIELEVVGQDSKTDTQNLNALATKSEVTKATKKVNEGETKDVTEEQTTTTTVKSTIESKVQVNPQEVVETTTAKTSIKKNENENLSVIVTESVHHHIVTQVVKNKEPETLVDSTQNQDTINLDEPEINLTLQELNDLFEQVPDKKSKVNHGSSFRPNNAQYKHTESKSSEESSESQESLSSESNSHEKRLKRSSDDSDESSESSESGSNEKSVHHHHHNNEKVQENHKHGNEEEKVLGNNKLTVYRPKLEVDDSILIQNL